MPVPTKAAPKELERLDPKDLVTHSDLLEQQRTVQTAVSFWTNHLARAYNLKQGDGIGPDGVIHRAEIDPETAALHKALAERTLEPIITPPLPVKE